MKLTSIKCPLLILVLPISLCRVLAVSLPASLFSSLASILGLLMFCGLNYLLNFLSVMFPSADFLQFDVLKSFFTNIIIVSLTVHMES